MRFTLRIWRQAGPKSKGAFVTHDVEGVEPDMSFLEMLDLLNERLTLAGEVPVAFDHDCREGICGSCALMIDGVPHGPLPGTATCQLYMRHYRDGAVITVEPWRARAFPVVRDLVVDRAALDRLMQAGGYVSVHAGSAPDANGIPVPKADADAAFEAAACIGCGACVAACRNASASLFVAAKVAQLALLPQGRPERNRRVVDMVEAMDREGFGGCSDHRECEAVCPKQIPVRFIALMHREFMHAAIKGREYVSEGPLTEEL